MTRANTEQEQFVPWFAKAGAACSIVPIARFVSPSIFVLKGGGYGCLFALDGIDYRAQPRFQLLISSIPLQKARCTDYQKIPASTSTRV